MPASSIAHLYHKYINRKAMLTVLDFPEIKRDGAVVRSASVGVEIPVWISDVRQAYGNEHVLIHPKGGVGSTWVETNRLRVVEEWPDEQEADSPAPDVEAAGGERGDQPPAPQI